jgi:hypothetical protein
MKRKAGSEDAVLVSTLKSNLTVLANSSAGSEVLLPPDHNRLKSRGLVERAA